MDKFYDKPGTYIEILESPKERMHATLDVIMINENGQMFVDSFSLSFNMTFLRTMKVRNGTVQMLIAVVGCSFTLPTISCSTTFIGTMEATSS